MKRAKKRSARVIDLAKYRRERDHAVFGVIADVERELNARCTWTNAEIDAMVEKIDQLVTRVMNRRDELLSTGVDIRVKLASDRIVRLRREQERGKIIPFPKKPLEVTR